MLIQAFPQLKKSAALRVLRDFFRSPVFFIIVVGLMVLSEWFSLELPVFYCYLAFVVVILLFLEDALPTASIACCGYMTISAPNSPARFPQETAFADPGFQIQFGFILLVILLMLVARIILLGIDPPRGRGKPRLLLGFALLGLAYMLGGVFTQHYSARTAQFGMLQILSLALFYLFYFFTVDPRDIPKWYFPALFTCIGFGILIEIAGMYTLPNVYVDGKVDRDALFTGWGVYNNVACVMAMCIPAPFYFAATHRRGWVFIPVATGFLIGLLFTQSRGGIIFGTITFLVCLVYVLLASKGRARQRNCLAAIALAVLFLILLIALRDRLDELFASILEKQLDPNGRSKIFKDCWETFLRFPYTGVGFYDTPGFALPTAGGFMPPRAHNTYLQLLATGGLMLAGAYFFHRAQTLVLLFQRPSHEKAFVALCILALLSTSLLDCHFFNIGPGILYGILLFYAEAMDAQPSGRRLLRART